MRCKHLEEKVIDEVIMPFCSNIDLDKYCKHKSDDTYTFEGKKYHYCSKPEPFQQVKDLYYSFVNFMAGFRFP